MKIRVFITVFFMALIFLVQSKSISCEAASSVTVNTYEELSKYLKDEKDYTITIGKNIEITGKCSVVGSKRILGNGKCLYRGVSFTSSYLISVLEGASLQMVSDLYISGNADNIKSPTKPLIRVAENSTLKLGSKVSLYNNVSDSAGGAIYNEGTIYIQGANIYNCHCNTSGGAIQMQKVSKCYMSGGRIYNNSASSYGGAIRQFDNTTLVVSGGMIDNNTCLTDGDAIYASGSFTLKGEGQIDKNNDVYLVTDSTIVISDWTKPTTIAITAYPQVGKKLIEGGSKYKNYFIWSDKQEKAQERPLVTVDANLCVGAYYPINYYTDSNKTNLYSSQTKLYGTAITLLTNGPKMTGYGFNGWFTKPSGGDKVSGTVYQQNAALNLYSQYSPNAYEVTFQSQGKSVGKAKVKYHNPYGDMPNPPREGYNLAGWYLDVNCTNLVTPKTIVTTAQAHTLYAGWSNATYQVSFNATGGEVGTKEKMVTYDTTYGILPIPNRDGYEFLGWYTAPSEGGRCDESTIVTTASNHTLYARWKGRVYTVSWDATGGVASFTLSNVVFGEKYTTLPEATRSGYELDGWYTEPEGGARCLRDTLVQTARDHIFYARWIKEESPKEDSDTPGTAVPKPVICIKKISMIGVKGFYKEKLSIGDTGMKLLVEYSNGAKLTLTKGWTIDSYSKVAGKRYVTFRYQGKTCKVTCIWLSSKDIGKIKPTKSTYSGYIGDKCSIKYSTSYSKKLQVTYKSSNSKVVQVSKTGTMTMKKAGTAYITMNIRLGSINKTIKVKIKVKKPSLTTAYSYGKRWNELQFKASVKGIAQKPTYSCSNTRVAKIDKKTGKLKAYRTGATTITIKAGSLVKKYRIVVNKSYRYIIIQ